MKLSYSAAAAAAAATATPQTNPIHHLQPANTVAPAPHCVPSAPAARTRQAVPPLASPATRAVSPLPWVSRDAMHAVLARAQTRTAPDASCAPLATFQSRAKGAAPRVREANISHATAASSVMIALGGGRRTERGVSDARPRIPVTTSQARSRATRRYTNSTASSPASNAKRATRKMATRCARSCRASPVTMSKVGGLRRASRFWKVTGATARSRRLCSHAHCPRPAAERMAATTRACVRRATKVRHGMD